MNIKKGAAKADSNVTRTENCGTVSAQSTCNETSTVRTAIRLHPNSAEREE